ncbi:MAG: DUF2793 domain-containing protein [Pseudotabrizicola sp.]|uniref:DUF2793 domain-containing protein n=1 Tax=Pseudotabrizicola sp. TaxID=2939647 RepID=UPI0027300266|nr:DUF2793 domain-containing protein [Pseudotabrizicola sp.]MDP2080628.1 DUF2793 domain-containing protein [Pseudotabrizicola sp.]MDZ7573357.1 DUF2793 domain-containing protein [Pseudotabrizicola sp.]
MPDDSPILSMPYILPAQAQKHVTHNEALRILDVIVQMVVQDRTRTEPPATPLEGDRHIVAMAATGAWSGQVGKIALREHGQWSFFAPLAGWRAHVLAESHLVTFDGTDWRSAAQQPLEVTQLGISATADPVNRLSVNAAATLLNHAGGGHQVKINKAAAVDTASLLFQSGFSGHAEMGLAGTNDFALKVSADGASWTEALRTDALSGRVNLPAGASVPNGSAAVPSVSFVGDGDMGLFRPADDQIGMVAGGVTRALLSASAFQISVPVSGSAVTQSTTDIAAGRLLKVGDYGLGASSAVYATDIDAITVNGGYRLSTGAFSTASPTPSLGAGWYLDHRQWDGNTAFQTLEIPSGDRFSRRKTGGTWQPWRRRYNAQTIVGAVSHAGGVPDGRIVERGANSNGDYVRFADGTQTCWRTLAASSSAGVNWTFPVAFIVAPVVTGNAFAAVQSVVMLDAAPSATAVTVSARGTNDARRADVMHIMAIGRWV